MNQAAVVELVPSGRDQELELLVRAHEESRSSGRARFALVHGPAGVGKSYLLRALRRALLGRGVRVFDSTASRHAPCAHGLFAGLVPELLAFLDELGVPGRAIASLSARLSAFAGGGADSRLGLEERRLDLCDALAELFALASAGTPAFLFSDVEAADPASLELLQYVAAAAAAPGARSGGLFVFAFRDGELPAPLRELQERLPAVNVPLCGLDLEGIRAFLARREVAERLLESTGGMPNALEEVVESPARPADLFERRLASLGGLERQALRALALRGLPAERELLAAVLALPAETLAEGLERLTRERLVEVHAALGGSRYSVARESYRQSLVGGLPAAEAARLHAAWGEALAAHGADCQTVARHFLAADPRGRGALEAERAADALATRLAFDEAAELYGQAIDGLDEARRPAVRLRLAATLRGKGDYTGALRELAYARPRLPPQLRREVDAEAAGLARQLGRLQAAELLCLKVLPDGELPDGADPVAARVFVERAEVLLLRGRFEPARSLCEQGARALASRPALALALRNTLGKVHLAQGELAEAAQVFVENARLAREHGAQREEARALINQGCVAHRRGEPRAAIGLYREGLERCGADRGLAATALSNLGSLYADSGEFAPAVEHLTRALSAFTRARRSKELAHCAVNLARLELFLADYARAEELCDHASGVAARVGDPYLVASAQLVRGELQEARGDAGEALASLSAALAQFEKLGSPRYAAESAMLLARVHLVRGDRALARSALARPAVDELCASGGSLAAEREMLSGELGLLAGDLSEATRRLSRAKELLLESPDLEGPWRVYHLLSRLRAAAGDAAGSASDGARARELLEQLAAKVPANLRTAFLSLPRRAAALSAPTARELTPARVARALELEPRSEPEVPGLIGSSAALRKIFKVLDAVARSNATVLVRGESGTGKELLAEAIHRRSPRRDLPLVRVNCGAMVEELLLSELFGHEKGAFTGAVRERKGRFELAEGGTIFLDEIGDVSPKAQVALLRVLQEREFERVGGQKTVKVDVRVICATNRDLEAMIAAGTFRQDLYYRLKGVMLELPPLRERLDDLPALCDGFLARLARERHEEKKQLSPEALELLRAHGWPGNVRELENVISSASIFAEGRVITPEAFEQIGELAPLVRAAGEEDDDEAQPSFDGPRAAPAPGGLDYFELARARGLSLKDLRQEMETQCILRALGEAKGNISEAARLLQMKRSRLSQIVNADPLLRSAAKG